MLEKDIKMKDLNDCEIRVGDLITRPYAPTYGFKAAYLVLALDPEWGRIHILCKGTLQDVVAVRVEVVRER